MKKVFGIYCSIEKIIAKLIRNRNEKISFHTVVIIFLKSSEKHHKFLKIKYIFKDILYKFKFFSDKFDCNLLDSYNFILLKN